MSMIRKVELHFDADQEEKHSNLPKHVVLKVVFLFSPFRLLIMTC